MTTIISNIPADLETSFLKESESSMEPVIRREGSTLFFPALVRSETRTIGNVEVTVYRYFDIPCAYTGQDIADYDKCKLQSYADLRRAFYGPVTVQLEQQLKGTFAKHQYAVKAAFPKTDGEVLPGVVRFNEIRTRFWALIDEACAAVGKTREDLPDSFNAEEMLAFAAENGMSAEQIADYTAKFSILSLNLLQNGRNWDELFA